MSVPNACWLCDNKRVKVDTSSGPFKWMMSAKKEILATKQFDIALHVQTLE